jgi:ABC-type Mn2+/Zn2+ transport system permease subunit
MLTLPSGCAGVFCKSLAGMMLLSGVFSVLFSICGLAAGWAFDLPVGGMTVIIAGIVFLGTCIRRLINHHSF